MAALQSRLAEFTRGALSCPAAFQLPDAIRRLMLEAGPSVKRSTSDGADELPPVGVRDRVPVLCELVSAE